MDYENDNSSSQTLREQALDFHKKDPAGKIEVVSSKQIETEQDLSLAYSPGVAFPCEEIAKDPSKAFDYTSRGNLIAVITNGTAVLGLGNIGPLAAKPVMEGKGILFKHFAGINVFDIELNTKNIDEFIQVCRALEPSVGGINLEDIAAPDCFEIEKRLEEELCIPVFHDDQHGTAIITCAALINACTINQKDLKNIKVVFSGAGSAAIACGHLLQAIGVSLENIIMCDSKGVIYEGRKENMNSYKQAFARKTSLRTLGEALKGADVFIGLSQKNIVTPQMVQSMASKPCIFAMANPDPEIHPLEARKACPDAIIATGRVDFPNQVNNVLGFPSIFRAALDIQATHINQEMKIAAVYALAELAREVVPESVSLAYGGESFRFGPDYIIPKPFDPRVVARVAPKVAQAAMKTGVARKPMKDWHQYQLKLEALLGARQIFLRRLIHHIRKHSKEENLPRIMFPEGESPRILKALQATMKESLYQPILLGRVDKVKNLIREMGLHLLEGVSIQDPQESQNLSSYARSLYELRKHKGMTEKEAQEKIRLPNYFASMSVHLSHVDGMVTGATQSYVESIRPVFQVIGTHGLASGMNLVLIKDQIFIFADTTVNIDPTATKIAQIAMHACQLAQQLLIEPRIALLSFSNFVGKNESPRKMQEAKKILKEKYPHVIVEGEMQADTAVNSNIMKTLFPSNPLKLGANILIFPNLDSGNIAYKLVQQLGSGEVIGPLLMGVKRPVDVVQRTGNVDDVIHTIWFNLLKIQAFKK